MYISRQAYYKEQFQSFSKYYYWKYIRPGRSVDLVTCIGWYMDGLGRPHVHVYGVCVCVGG